MGVLDEKRWSRNRGRLFLSWLCVLLVVLCGTLLAVHTHPNETALHADCSLCAAAHVTAQVTQSPAPAPPVAIVTLPESATVSVVPTALSTFALFIRPPPVAVIPA
jgi:hypothetical protein